MKGFSHQNYFLKDKWLDLKHTKNHPKTCEKAHSFCNFQYEWSQQKQSQKVSGTLINASIPNVTLPKRQQRAITVNYDAITEQDLDDWIAQSLNRNITSILNPQKSFYIPSELQDDLKHRYRKKSSLLKGDEDVYFGSTNLSKKKKTNPKKGKIEVSDLVFNYKNLQVKHTPGIPIRIRQNRNKKMTIKRRNAVFLDQDVHYGRLIKDMSKSKQKNVKKQNTLFMTETQTMFYSYNIQSLNRKSFIEETPSSITQKQYNRLKEPPKDVLSKKEQTLMRREAMHQKFRSTMNDIVKTSQNILMEKGSSPFKSWAKTASTPKEVKSMTDVQKPAFKLRSMKRQNSNITSSMIDTKSIGRDKILQKKILALLNDMQILSEDIDFEMSQLNIHVNEVSLKTIDSRPQTKWVIKAQQKLAQKQTQLSIDCYKQALIIQPEFFVPIFNIASLMEKQKMYFQAIRWFEICKEFEIDEENVHFGMAIVYLKQMKFEECYAIIEELIKKFTIGKQNSKLFYHYIRALCCKKLRKYDQTKSDYSILLKVCPPINYIQLSSYMFSVVFAKPRRLALKFDCLSYMKFKETLEMVYYTPESKIRQDNEPMRNIAKKLVNAPFFKRFSISLVEKLLEKSTYEIVKNDSLIFINEDETAVVLSGIVMVRNHLKDFDKPETIFVIQQGGIIGGGQLDNFMNEKANNWFIAKSDVELIKIQRKSFNEFWKGQITFEVDFKYNFLKNVALFRSLPDSTLLRICEKIQKVEYGYGTILFNDCSYRNELINKKGVGFGLGKKTNSTDSRFVNMKKMNLERKKGKCRIYELLKKHYKAFEDMKFNKFKYPGLFILIKGQIEVQDDRGFRCADLIGEREYFGQNLLVDSDGFHNYGRMVVSSKSAQLYYLPVQRLMWCFTLHDKSQMKQNTKSRQSVETLRFLRSRFLQCQNTRLNYKYLMTNGR